MYSSYSRVCNTVQINRKIDISLIQWKPALIGPLLGQNILVPLTGGGGGVVLTGLGIIIVQLHRVYTIPKMSQRLQIFIDLPGKKQI